VFLKVSKTDISCQLDNRPMAEHAFKCRFTKYTYD